MNAPRIIVTAHIISSMGIDVVELDVEELVAQPLNDAGV